jgi:hypothetical protein
MVAPHEHTVDEVKSNIRKIEHNEAGQGPGPSGKHGGPPSGIEGGSAGNVGAAGSQTGVTQHEKGQDWISGKGE